MPGFAVVRPRLAAGALALAMTVACAEPEDPVERYLERSWNEYQELYLLPDGYVLDRERDGGRVTSEGQSYALLRAAWLRDAASFERVWHWTDEHLRRPDGLHSWLWTPADGGRVLDRNTASDADQDIAFALVVAGVSFDRPDYLERARELVVAIRRETALRLPDGWFPAAGNWAREERIVNLSYFTPYAYPYFALLDPDGRWEEALAGGYALLAAALASAERRLVPDFLVATEEGSVEPLPPGSGLEGAFSFDAMRLPWRVALDCRLHGRPRACAEPAASDTLAELLQRDGALYTRYALDGTPLSDDTSLSFYGGALPALALHAPATAESLRRGVLAPAELDTLSRQEERYYDLNWVWFGLAADRGLIAERTPSVEELAAALCR